MKKMKIVALATKDHNGHVNYGYAIVPKAESNVTNAANLVFLKDVAQPTATQGWARITLGAVQPKVGDMVDVNVSQEIFRNTATGIEQTRFVYETEVGASAQLGINRAQKRAMARNGYNLAILADTVKDPNFAIVASIVGAKGTMELLAASASAQAETKRRSATIAPSIVAETAAAFQ